MRNYEKGIAMHYLKMGLGWADPPPKEKIHCLRINFSAEQAGGWGGLYIRKIKENYVVRVTE
jgi:hypothetical protein